MEINDVKIYQYDAVIVGAGLAGLAAANELKEATTWETRTPSS